MACEPVRQGACIRHVLGDSKIPTVEFWPAFSFKREYTPNFEVLERTLLSAHDSSWSCMSPFLLKMPQQGAPVLCRAPSRAMQRPPEHAVHFRYRMGLKLGVLLFTELRETGKLFASASRG